MGCSKHFLFSMFLFSLGASPASASEIVKRADSEEKIETIEIRGAKVSQDLNQINETGSNLDLSNLKTPASIELISQEEMQLKGQKTTLEAVSTGVGMTGGQPPGAPTIFSSRGFSGSNITHLYDGLELLALE